MYLICDRQEKRHGRRCKRGCIGQVNLPRCIYFHRLNRTTRSNGSPASDPPRRSSLNRYSTNRADYLPVFSCRNSLALVIDTIVKIIRDQRDGAVRLPSVIRWETIFVTFSSASAKFHWARVGLGQNSCECSKKMFAIASGRSKKFIQGNCRCFNILDTRVNENYCRRIDSFLKLIRCLSMFTKLISY